VLAGVLAMLCGPARADVSLPSILGSNMVLQREQPVPIWGWASPGEKVSVTLDQQKLSATADDKGNWKVMLAPMKAGGPYQVVVAGENTLKLSNVMVGEVWLCSGQSNMEFPTYGALDAKKEIEGADKLGMHLFRVAGAGNHLVQKDVKGQWVVCDSGSANGFSAVGFFFGRHVAKELKVPVGMIDASLSASPIQGWMPPQAWQGDVRLETEYNKARAQTTDLDNMWKPSTLHNAMIAPLIPYGLRGMLWYQGESNAGGDKLHNLRFNNLVTTWRKMWGQGDFPFLYVQLPNYNGPPFWAPFRELQAMSLALPNTGMAVTLDIGEPNNIHPPNKQEVARRLWLIAAAKVYGKTDVEYSGPVYASMKVEGSKAVLTFTHLGGGLVAKGSADGKTLTGFVVAGEDGKFLKAQAAIDGPHVVVWSDSVERPATVRYAWAPNPTCNLFNRAGLPAGSFRTDPSGPTMMPTRRPAAIDVPYAKDPITVDGDGADWKDIAPMPEPFMHKDAGSVKLCWREEGLYGLVVARVERIKVVSKEPWAGDAFELFLEKDAAGLGERSDVTAQYVFAPDPSGEEGRGLSFVAFGPKTDKAKLDCQWKKTADGYVLEFLIPARVLKPAKMAAGSKIGCNFALDHDGKAVEQFFVDKSADESWGVPAAWGLLRLAKP
jgi:sialate O-acetylesterase